MAYVSLWTYQMEHVFGPTNQIEILTGTTYAYTEGVITCFEIKYNVSTHMRTAFPNSLSLGSPRPPVRHITVKSLRALTTFDECMIWRRRNMKWGKNLE